VGLAGHKFLNVMAPLDDWLLSGTFVNTVTSLIDVKQNMENNAMGGAFFTEGFVMTPWMDGSKSTEDLDNSIEGNQEWGELTPYDLVLMGFGINNGTESITISLYYSDSGAAARDAQELEKRWNSFKPDPGRPQEPEERLPVTHYCSPLSTEVISSYDFSILSATCTVTELEDRSPARGLWSSLININELQFLIPDLEMLNQGD
jgi:hypothetical protein